jgi:hypothetical protein
VQGFHQRNKTLRFITNWNEWHAVQNGAKRDFVPSHFDDELHYVRNGRDLSRWVHIDVLFQGYFNACLMLLQGPGAASSVGSGIGSSPSPVDKTGRETLMSYNCGSLTIEGELNKLASNIALGRNIAGVHRRSDGTYSLELGEQVAIKLLEAYARSYVELSPGTLAFQFNKFDGTQHSVHA